MRKQIKNIKNGKVIIKEMNIEEVMNEFKGLINTYTRRAYMVSPMDEIEDLRQLTLMTVVETFNEYDIEFGTAFSTLLVTNFRGMISTLKAYESAEKRSKYEKVSTETVIGNDAEDTLGDIIGEEDTSFEDVVHSDLIRNMFMYLSESEKDMYIYMIDRNMSLTEYATMRGKTRQAMNYTHKKLMSKLADLYTKLSM